MNKLVAAAFVAAFFSIPFAAFADSNPPPGPGAGGPMEQVRGQMEAARAQARTAALNALTPENRTRLGQLFAQLATAQTPDVDGAAKALDATLSPSETKAILSAQSALDAQMRSIMDQARSQMGGGQGGNGPMGGGPNGGGPSGGGQHQMQGSGPQTQDAGMALLQLALPPVGRPVFYRMGGPPPPGS